MGAWRGRRNLTLISCLPALTLNVRVHVLLLPHFFPPDTTHPRRPPHTNTTRNPGIAQGGSGGSSNPRIRISVQVQGLGPNFTLKVWLQNTSQTTVTHSKLLLAFDADKYEMGHGKENGPTVQAVPVQMLLPGPRHLVEVPLRCITEGAAGEVLVLLTSAVSGSLPLVSASVKMPLSEMDF